MDLKTQLIRDLNWCVGFIEGEGTFYANKYGSLHVTVNQVQRWPLEKLSSVLGGIIGVRKSCHPRWQDQWQWRTSGYRAGGIMMTLFVLLSPKRQEQIRKSLLSWKTHQARVGIKLTCRNGHAYLPNNLLFTKISKTGKTTRRCRICHTKNRKRSNAQWRESANRQPAQCHPERKSFAKGLCSSCYLGLRYNGNEEYLAHRRARRAERKIANGH